MSPFLALQDFIVIRAPPFINSYLASQLISLCWGIKIFSPSREPSSRHMTLLGEDRIINWVLRLTQKGKWRTGFSNVSSPAHIRVSCYFKLQFASHSARVSVNLDTYTKFSSVSPPNDRYRQFYIRQHFVTHRGSQLYQLPLSDR